MYIQNRAFAVLALRAQYTALSTLCLGVYERCNPDMRQVVGTGRQRGVLLFVIVISVS